ncbi:NUDIX domain-containing protein [Nocardioides sp. CER19]|uniref:NUDIX hydrolase n=1 Tax=Nocardioides sp. CER19 TaxID=3038538 RepID=UPI00244B7AE3|nr:NUDIX domain-containing protein [Nocardioides sp. CER19]MDH2415972.1 NUDIX domain-containing protein [Nocardioides sp. CER19]
MPIPEYVAALRSVVGPEFELWLPGVTAVVVRPADELLLVRRADDGSWAPVTGIIDPGEEPAVAARREALEETGVEISVDRLVSVAAGERIVHANGDRAVYLDLTFACTWLSGEAYVADDESLEVGWFRRDALPPMRPHMAERIAAALSGEATADFHG